MRNFKNLNIPRFGLRRSIFILALSTLVFNSCHPLPNAQAYTTITVRLTGFMHDCFSGDANNGTSTSHVNYNYKVTSEEYSGGSYRLTDTKTGVSPTGPDKSQLDVSLQIPDGTSYRITATIDATECSICNQTYCNRYRASEFGTFYVFDTGRPYWTGSAGYSRPPSNGILAFTPVYTPRYPNRMPPEDCNCKIKDN